jgi:hypothetical protein
MTMPNAVVVQSSIARHSRAASTMLGRVFAWIGGTAIGLVLGLGRISIAELGIWLAMVILSFCGLAQVMTGLCMLGGVVFQYQVTSDSRQNMLMIGVGFVGSVAAHAIMIADYRIHQLRLDLRAGSYRSVRPI